MYNQVNRGPHFGQSSVPAVPPPPAPLPYQQGPPHFHQFPPPNIVAPPPPHLYLHGPPPPTSTSTIPLTLPIQGSHNVMQNAGQSYVTPPQLHPGNTLVPQTSWTPGLPTRLLPPPPPPPSSSQAQILYNPPFYPPPQQPGNVQNLHEANAPPPPPPSMHLRSTVGNYQTPSIVPPPLPSSPPPVPPSPPPLTPPMTSVPSHAACADHPNSVNMTGLESNVVDSFDGVVGSHPSGVAPARDSDSIWDSGNCREVAVAGRDEDQPPPKPTEENTVQRIETLCQLIAENGADIEDKICQDEFQNPEYAFLCGGDPGTEAATSHTYFLWMKKKYKLDTGWHEKKRESQIVESSGKHCHLDVATVSADSDMEMEDDITLSDKDQGSNYATEAITQQHNWVNEVFGVNQNIQQQQNSTENDPAKDVSSCSALYFESIETSKHIEGSGILSDLEDMKSAKSVNKVDCPVNDSTEVAKFPMGTVLVRSATPVDNDFLHTDTSGHYEATNPGLITKSGSPIRLLQNYASDDTSDNEDEGCAMDANVFTVLGGASIGVSTAHKDSGSYMETDIGSKSPSSAQKGFGPFSKTSHDDLETSLHIVQESKETGERSISRWTSDGCIEHNHEDRVSINFASSIEACRGKDGLKRTGIDSGSKSCNAEQEDFESNVLKLDEFGRQLREGPTESDSDDSHCHKTRRLNERDKNQSCSRSPPDRSRHRRSSQRRKDRRNRSHSWSPRHRRSMSRSRILRRSGDFCGENVKRGKGQCMDFFRGKCYRGASCKYVHHESDINATSKHCRNKHDLEVHSHAKESRINQGMKNSSKVLDYKRDGIRSQDMNLCHKVTSQEVVQKKKDLGKQAVVSSTACFDGQSVSNNQSKSKGFREVAPEIQETIVGREEPKTLFHENDSFQKAGNSHPQHFLDNFHPEALTSGDASKPSGTYKDVIIPSEDGSFVPLMQPDVSVGVPEHSVYPSQLLNASFGTDSLPDKRSIVSTSVNKLSSGEPLPLLLPLTQLQSATSSVSPSVTSEQPLLPYQAPKELPSHSGSSGGLPLHIYQLPASFVSHSQGENAVHMPQISRQYGVMQQSTFFPFQSTTREKFESYPAPLHPQNSHFGVPSNNSWTSLLPPPPPSRAMYNSSLNSGVESSYIASEFNHSQLHSRTDSVSQTPMKPGLPTHFQNSEFEDQAYPPMQDHSRTFMLTESLSPKHLPHANLGCQLLSGSNLNREDLHNQLPLQDSKFSSTTSFGSLHSPPKQFSWESDVNRQPSLGSKLPSKGHLMTSSHIHSSLQKQESMYKLQCFASKVNLGVHGEIATVSRYPADFLDSNHSTSFPSFEGSRISAHYNPYASTFEKPLSSKFSSSIYRQENELILGNNYASSRLNHAPINREHDGVGSRQSASSPKSTRPIGQILPRAGHHQYDPLFDSIEPSSSSPKQNDFDQKQEVTGESNLSVRPKSSYMSLDLEEKTKHEEFGAVASTTSQNNDEYGETADAEVGAVENESLSDHVDIAKVTTGDVEINQVKSPGKRKKSKDSRSMKLFKVSIANFVKEVLKPSWRQGNMSKVAFKTIVKKTVDKVSGAMKGHRVPKSQAKISQYIESSQRKLTKLVMGYVDKYVKV